MTANRPYFVGSQTSGVDGSSEGGRISTMRLPSTLVIYGVPLIDALRREGYQGKLSAEPALDSDGWVLKVTYEGEEPPPAPPLWHGHRVVVEKAPPADG